MEMMKIKFLKSTENSNINPHLGQLHISYRKNFRAHYSFDFSFRFPLRKMLEMHDFEKIREIFKNNALGCSIWSVLHPN